MGNVTATTTKNAGTTIVRTQTQTFDELGRLLSQIGASSQTTTFAYDKVSNLTGVTDPRSNTYSYAFDALNRLIKETDEANEVIDYTLDGQGEVVTYEDPRNLQTTYVRNGFGDVLRRTSPDTGITDYVVNALGLTTQMTDARGIVTTYSYDDAGRMLTKTFPASASENVTYTWDGTAGGNKGTGRLTHIADHAGSTAITYDVRGNILSEVRTIASQAHTVAYSYDLADNVDTITYPSGRTVTYTRDATGQITGVTTRKSPTDPVVNLATGITWQPFGPLQGFTHGNGLTHSKTFDNDYRLNELLVRDTGTATDLLKRTHSYTDSLNLTGIANAVDATYSQTLTYAATRRLLAASGKWGDLTFAYDGVGNRTERVLDDGATVTTELFNISPTSNRLSTVTVGAATTRAFTHDGAGNITGDTRGAQVYAHVINHAGRISEVTLGGLTQASYLYNAAQQLVSRTLSIAPVGTTHFIHDSDGNVIAETDGFGDIACSVVRLLRVI